MKILFYTTPPPPAAEVLLFTEQWVQFMVGQTVTHGAHTYQVNALEWVDDTRKELKAFCTEIFRANNPIIFDDEKTN